MKIGVIREGKVPPDSRVTLTPKQSEQVNSRENVDIYIQPSPIRCFPDQDYINSNAVLQEDLNSCDVLLGVKEVPIDQLVENKTYFFFSHTIKKQSYNKKLLLAILQKNIRLIDYEVLTNDSGKRLIAFGKFAGMVGAHNGIMTYGARTGAYTLKRIKDCVDYKEAKQIYKELNLPAIKVVLTGTGRVGNGAALVLDDMGFQKVDPSDFLSKTFDGPVYTQLQCSDYAARTDGSDFTKEDFYKRPELFKSIFEPYTKVSDIMINGIYWDNNAPAFFTQEDMTKDEYNIKVIADVTCDIAPISSIPSTIKASTIADPIFGFDPSTGKEIPAFQDNGIDMMTIDNLPNELPRDASTAFGEQFITYILDELLKEDSPVIKRATIAENGELGPHFQYLKDWVEATTSDT